MTQVLQKSDREIHQAVLCELQWDTHVNEMDVGVEVDDGIVTLTGIVDSYAKKMAALDAVRRVAGVQDVANDIQVKVPGSPGHTDTEIAQALRQVLAWDVFIPGDKIKTTVSNGWVTLEGTVPYWIDRANAERAIRNLAGVRGINNKLVVKPPQVAKAVVQRSIEDALERRADREAGRIQVEVKDGAVALSGRVHNWSEKQAILGAVGHAPGVVEVEDHLSIDPYC